MKIKIFLTDDHALFRQGMYALLEDTNIEVVGEAGSGEETLDKLKTVHPDILLLDISMTLMNGVECAKLLRKEYPTIKVLVLSMHDTENNLAEMIDAGVKGYMLKSGSKEELVFAIKHIFNGYIYISSEFLIKKLRTTKSAAENANTLIVDLKLSER
ncbi:MAG TPA: response regulator transcription factor, partial [Bacteroidia bacterium]|nr:response regulator transcription factor [Bacteroidia bacterium]